LYINKDAIFQHPLNIFLKVDRNIQQQSSVIDSHSNFCLSPKCCEGNSETNKECGRSCKTFSASFGRLYENVGEKNEWGDILVIWSSCLNIQ